MERDGDTSGGGRGGGISSIGGRGAGGLAIDNLGRGVEGIGGGISEESIGNPEEVGSENGMLGSNEYEPLIGRNPPLGRGGNAGAISII